MEENFEQHKLLGRRKILTALGIAGFSVVSGSVLSSDKVKIFARKIRHESYENVHDMIRDNSLKEDNIVQTYGYYKFGDGGAAKFIIEKPDGSSKTNLQAGIILDNNLIATLVDVGHVNYKMFGAMGDGNNDDSIQIKAAHAYANKLDIPVINLNGEFWLKQTRGIEILTNVDWGNTVFHIDEKLNSVKESRFKIVGRKPEITINLNNEQKSNLLQKLKPGVKIISELAPYKNCLVIIADKNDPIGFRAGARYHGQSWAREELFYVEEHGSIIGDIAWEFKDYSSLIAYPVDTNYLTINGGTFYLSGDSPGTKYMKNGFSITRSRTIIQNQWVGLEPEKVDISLSPRSGFYSYTRVYDVKLENVRLIPYEQDREGTVRDVSEGTYGISGSRVLNALFRNVTAEGGPVHWGVFGTNLNKNFRIENCRLNRVDVHFHCWNLYIKDSNVGYRGISVTGGGDLFIENTTCYCRSFINFRRDFGSKWDGHIRLYNCRFIPASMGAVAILDFDPMDFDYKYPLGFGRSVIVENLVIDFSSVPTSKSECWLMKIPAFSKTSAGKRLFFPNYVEFRNVFVEGRDQGVRLIAISDPQTYNVDKRGGYDGIQIVTNSRIVFNNIQLEDLAETESPAGGPAHISINNLKKNKYEDEFSLYPEIHLVDCKNVIGKFEHNAADLIFERCCLIRLAGEEKEMPGRFTFSNCLFQASSKNIQNLFYSLSSELGTSFTNCTIYAPQINGVMKPELTDLIDFVKINKTVRYNHLNTQLGKDIVNYYKNKGVAFNKLFISMLKSHHLLEAENI